MIDDDDAADAADAAVVADDDEQGTEYATSRRVGSHEKKDGTAES